MTEWGGLTYLRAPMGLTSSSDIFYHRTDSALAGIPGLHKLVDDILVQVGTSVTFSGFAVDQAGKHPDPKKVEALRDFPPPKDLTNLKSFRGLANQLGELPRTLSNLSNLSNPYC